MPNFLTDALEQIIADLDSAEEWAKRTNVGHIHGRLDQARYEARAALAQLEAAEVWFLDRSNHLWSTAEEEHPALRNKLERVLVIPDPEPK